MTQADIADIARANSMGRALLVSGVVLACNHEKHIAQAIESILIFRWIIFGLLIAQKETRWAGVTPVPLAALSDS